MKTILVFTFLIGFSIDGFGKDPSKYTDNEYSSYQDKRTNDSASQHGSDLDADSHDDYLVNPKFRDYYITNILGTQVPKPLEDETSGIGLAKESTGSKCTNINGCPKGKGVRQPSKSNGGKQNEKITFFSSSKNEKSGKSSEMGAEQCSIKMKNQLAEVLDKHLGPCIEAGLKAAGQNPVCSNPQITHMGIHRDKGDKGGGGRAANSCHKASEAIDISKVKCGAEKSFEVLQGAEPGEPNDHAKFFLGLKHCLDKTGKFDRSLVYNNEAHHNHIHIQLKGCMNKKNGYSGAEMCPGAKAGSIDHQNFFKKNFPAMYALLFGGNHHLDASTPPADYENPTFEVKNLLSRQISKSTKVTVTNTYHGEPVALPEFIEVKLDCRGKKKQKVVFSEKVCTYTNHGFDAKTGRLWLSYTKPVFDSIGFAHCTQAEYASLQLSKNCKVKRIDRKSLGKTSISKSQW